MVVGLLFLVVIQLAGTALRAGRMRLALRALRGHTPSADNFFDGVKTLGSVFVIEMLVLLVAALLAFVAAIPALLWAQSLSSGLDFSSPEAISRMYPALLLFFAIYGVLMIPGTYVTIPLSLARVPAADGAGLIASLRLGFAAAEGHRFSVFAIQLVTTLALIPAVLLCCIGIPFGLAFVDLGLATSYLAYAPRGSGSGSAGERRPSL